MIDPLKIPEKTRLRLVELCKARDEAIDAANKAITAADDLIFTIVEMAGLDSGLKHSITLETGVIVPAETPAQLVPTPIKKEEVAS